MSVACVTIENVHYFSGPVNPIAAQHRLRHDAMIGRQGWNVPSVKGRESSEWMEYDQYDNPAAYYLVCHDHHGKALGCSRFYPTDRPYMLQQVFSHLVTETALPASETIWEGSRFVIDHRLPARERKRTRDELILGYLEFGLRMRIEHFIGVMLPAYWRNLFISLGWPVEFLGDAVRLDNSDSKQEVRAGQVTVSEEYLRIVRERTGIFHPVVYFGDLSEIKKAA